MKLTRKQLIINAAFCITLLLVIIWALYSEYNRPWKKYQEEFNELSKLPPLNSPLGKGGDRGVKIQQIWLLELGETDRCITCHQGIDNPDFKNEPQPYKTHSGDYLKHHRVEKFGCVVCHAGQGAALTVKDAHGDVKNWGRPLLKGLYAQSSCNKCHLTGPELPLSSELSGASEFIEGWRLFKEYSCIGCHKLTGYKRPERIAPSLSRIGSKVNRDWLVKWLKNPKDYISGTKMPRFNMSDEEINYVADYLMSLSPPLNSPLGKGGDRGVKVGDPHLLRGVRGVFPSLAKNMTTNKLPPPLTGGGMGVGESLITQLGCLGCHKIGDKGNDFAPAFTDIGNKVRPEWLYQFLKSPKSYDPETIIPDFKLSDEEVRGIAAYLMSLRKNGNINTLPFIPSHQGRGELRGLPIKGVKINESALPLLKSKPTIPSPLAGEGKGEGRFYENIEKGRKLLKNLGCTGCHKIEDLPSSYYAPDLDNIGNKRVEELVFADITDVDRTLINWFKIKVTEPGRFATDKIITRMPNYNFNKEQAEALVTFLLSIKNDSVSPKYMKTLIDPDSAEMRGKNLLERYNCLGCHKIYNEGGNIGPDITAEGRKSRPEWLFSFLKKPHKIRPSSILQAKMPDFSLSDKEVNAIIEYLASVSGEAYPYKFEPQKEIASSDIWNGEKLYYEIFACSGCHSVDGRGGEIGPEHTDLANRLKREWIEQWLKDPQAIQSDVRMPRFKFKDWEFEALTDYLMTLGKYRFVQVKNNN